ncbi:MAG: hypothetical protein U0893_23350 [Chloroflexota bacterium]
MTARWLQAGIAAALFLVALVVLSAEAASAGFEADEADYVATSRYFGYLFLQHDVRREEWGSNHWTRTQPPLTRYIVGVWLTARGYDLEKLNQPYVSTASSFEVNRQKGRVPTDDVLAAARQPMVLLGAAAIALLYPLGVLLAGSTAGPLGASAPGLLAVALALTSSFLRYTLVHAWAEAPIACFLLLSACLAAYGARHLATGGSIARWGGGLGLALGLASATKLTGLVGLPIVALAAVFALVMRPGHRSPPPLPRTGEGVGGRGPGQDLLGARGVVAGSAVAVVVALAVFVGLNPYLWRGPVSGMAGMLDERQREMTEQQEQWPEFAVYGAGDRLWQTAVGSTRVGPWGEQPLAASVVGLAFGALGLAAAVRRAWPDPLDRLAVLTLVAWLAVYTVAILAGLKLSYPRYFLPSCLLLLPFCGTGAAIILHAVARQLQRARQPRHGGNPPFAPAAR